MKKQNGYVYRRGGWWVLRYRENLLENGQTVRKQLAKQLTPIKPEHKRLRNAPAEVLDMAEDFLRPLNRGTANPLATQTIGEFAENEFFPSLEKDLRQSTRKAYRARWESQLRRRCGDVRLRDFNVLSAQRVIDDVIRQNTEMKRSSLIHLKNLLSLIFNEALRLGIVDAARGNPAKLIRVPRLVTEEDETHAYSLRDVETMLAILPEPAATVCAVAAFAGLRRSELRGVRWEDYNGERIMVMRSVWEGFTNDPKTKRSKAAVPVIPRLRVILETHKLACGNPKGTRPMFANGKGRPANLNNTLNREILPVLNRCGVCRKSKLSHADRSHEYVRDGSLPEWHGFHSFRRGLATTLYSLGVDDFMVQKILRHQDVSVTRERYIKTVPEQSVTAMGKLEAALCADRALETVPSDSILQN